MTAELERERGETLVELLIALVIVAIGVVAVIGGLATSITMSGIHRNQSTGATVVRDYAESVQTFVAGSGYTPCALPSDYSPANTGFTSPDANYTASAVSIKYWNGTSFVSTCSDIGLQQLTVQAAGPDTRVAEQLVIVLRKPCGATSTCT